MIKTSLSPPSCKSVAYSYEVDELRASMSPSLYSSFSRSASVGALRNTT